MTGGSVFIGESGAIALPHVALPILLLGDSPAPEIEEVKGESTTTPGRRCAGRTKDHRRLSLRRPAHGDRPSRQHRDPLPGTTLEWDPVKLQITNHEQAQKLITKNYRDGWVVKPA